MVVVIEITMVVTMIVLMVSALIAKFAIACGSGPVIVVMMITATPDGEARRNEERDPDSM